MIKNGLEKKLTRRVASFAWESLSPSHHLQLHITMTLKNAHNSFAQIRQIISQFLRHLEQSSILLDRMTLCIFYRQIKIK